MTKKLEEELNLPNLEELLPEELEEEQAQHIFSPAAVE